MQRRLRRLAGLRLRTHRMLLVPDVFMGVSNPDAVAGMVIGASASQYKTGATVTHRQ